MKVSLAFLSVLMMIYNTFYKLVYFYV